MEPIVNPQTWDITSFSYRQAMMLLAQNKLTSATQVLEEGIALTSNDPTLWKLLGLCQYALGQFSDAQRSWTCCVALADADSQALEYLGSMSTPEFETFVQRFNASLNNLAQKNFLSALLLLWPTLQPLPNLECYNLAGLLFYQLGLKKSAIRLWQKSLQLDATNAPAVDYLCQAQPGWIPAIIEQIGWEVCLWYGKMSGITKFSV